MFVSLCVTCQADSKIYVKCKRLRRAKTILKKNEAWRLHCQISKPSFSKLVIKPVILTERWTNGPVRNNINSSEIDPYLKVTWFIIEVTRHCSREGQVFSTIGCGYPQGEKSWPLPLTRWVTDLNVEENSEKHCYDLEVGIKCLNKMQKVLIIMKKKI